MAGTIKFDFQAINALYGRLSQEASSMEDTLNTVLNATNQVGQEWSGHAHDQFQAAISDWQQYGQRLANDLATLRDLMKECADSFQNHDAEFASVWNKVG